MNRHRGEVTDPGADLLDLFRAALDAVRPEKVMPLELPTAGAGRLALIAAGKAAAEMMRVAEARRRVALTGLAVTRYGHVPEKWTPGPGIVLIEAGHPAPDSNSLSAGRAALELARSLGADDRLLVLLSGGGSSLLAVPAPGVTLADKQAVTQALLRSGAAIGEINIVRKHLSAIKGGRLAAAAAPAAVTTWLISDVPGDDPSLVASGPTVADRSTPEEAHGILARHRIAAPPAVSAALADRSSRAPAVAEGDVAVLARGGDALAAAAILAGRRGYAVTDLGDRLGGEAQALGRAHAGLAREAGAAGERRAILSGGETEVALAGPAGRGGRNLEYLLGLAVGLDGAAGIWGLACDTDGIDGTGPAAGAMLRPDTLTRARALGLDPQDHLHRHDSLGFFEALGDSVVTGPTLTNVADFRVVLIDGRAG